MKPQTTLVVTSHWVTYKDDDENNSTDYQRVLLESGYEDTNEKWPYDTALDAAMRRIKWRV